MYNLKYKTYISFPIIKIILIFIYFVIYLNKKIKIFPIILLRFKYTFYFLLLFHYLLSNIKIQ